METKKHEYSYMPMGETVNTLGDGSNDQTNNCNVQCAEPTEMIASNKTFLFVAASIVNLAVFTCGIAFGWSSPVIPKLSNNVTSPLPEPVTVDQTSWIGSLLPVGAALSPFIAGPAADKIGRKLTLLISVIPFIVAFIGSAFAKTIYIFYLARFLCGLGTGAIFTVLPMYIGEISEPSVRGALASMLQLFVTFGLLFSYAVGPYISLMAFNLVCVVVPAAFLVLMFVFVPESPYYLIACNKEDEAKQALMKFRSKEDVSAELSEIKKGNEESKEDKGSFMDIFKSNGLKKALMLSIGLVLFQQFSGINVILYYTETIFGKTHSSIPADISTIIIGIVQVTFSCVSPMLVDKKGKRFLLLISSIGMALFQIILGYYFRQIDVGNDVGYLFWLPILCLVGYNATYCVGFGPLPWAVLGEMFPAKVKSAASTITASGCWIMAFVITKYFSTLTDAIGDGFSFYIFGGFCVLAGIFVYKYLPETSGKSLQEIQEILEGRTSDNL